MPAAAAPDVAAAAPVAAPGAADGDRQAQRRQQQQRVLEATRTVIAGSPTLGIKSVFAAVVALMDPADKPTAKEVRRALAQVKPKAPKPTGGAAPRPAAAAGWSGSAAADREARADYTHCRVDPAALNAGGAAPQLELLRAAQAFIESHRTLLERQAFDIYFVVDSMWETLVPAEWREALAAGSPAQLAGLCLGLVPQSWPPSLHDFVRTAQSLQLDPTPQQPAAATTAAPATAGDSAASSWKRHWRGTSPKKREEMERMAIAIVNAATTTGTRNVVDVGSGKGYLSSLLAMEHGLQVLAVEGNGKFTAAAEERVSRIARRRPAAGGEGGGDGFFSGGGAEGLVEPIFVTAMVSAVRPSADASTRGALAAQQPQQQEQQLEGAAAGGTQEEEEDAAAGLARAAQIAKEERSRSMRQQYTTGAAADAIAVSGTSPLFFPLLFTPCLLY